MRTARKLTAVAASAALVVSCALLSAPAAHAVDTIAVSAGSVSPSTATGTRVAVSNTSGASIRLTSSSISLFGSNCSTGCSVANGSTTLFDIVTGASAGTVTVEEFPGGVPGPTIGTFTVTYSASGGGDGGSSSSAAGSAPAPVIQQFGKPASGTCDEAAPADLNLAGVGLGGWGESWAQWMNGGSGGAVCTRTLSYVGSGWTVS